MPRVLDNIIKAFDDSFAGLRESPRGPAQPDDAQRAEIKRLMRKYGIPGYMTDKTGDYYIDSQGRRIQVK